MSSPPPTIVARERSAGWLFAEDGIDPDRGRLHRRLDGWLGGQHPTPVRFEAKDAAAGRTLDRRTCRDRRPLPCGEASLRLRTGHHRRAADPVPTHQRKGRQPRSPTNACDNQRDASRLQVSVATTTGIRSTTGTLQRRMNQGKMKRETFRCPKRYLARGLFRNHHSRPKRSCPDPLDHLGASRGGSTRTPVPFELTTTGGA